MLPSPHNPAPLSAIYAPGHACCSRHCLQVSAQLGVLTTLPRGRPPPWPGARGSSRTRGSVGCACWCCCPGTGRTRSPCAAPGTGRCCGGMGRCERGRQSQDRTSAPTQATGHRQQGTGNYGGLSCCFGGMRGQVLREGSWQTACRQQHEKQCGEHSVRRSLCCVSSHHPPKKDAGTLWDSSH